MYNFMQKIKIISDKIEKNANQMLREFDITYSQARIIVVMARMKGEAVPLKELEKLFEVSQQTMAGIVSRLEAKGFVHAVEDERDRRVKQVCLTEQGRTLGDAVTKKMKQAERRIVKGLSKEEISQMDRFLSLVLENAS